MTTRHSSLAFRLAATYALLVAATLLVAVGVTARLVRAHLTAALDADLAAAARSFQRAPAAHASTPAALTTRARIWLATDPLPQGEMAAVRIGRIVLTSARGREMFEVGNPEHLLAARRARWLEADGSEGRTRVLAVPIRSGSRQLGTLVLLAYEKRVEGTLRALLTDAGWANGIGLLFALAFGTLAVRRSLRPLRRMADEVELVETADLAKRVTQPAADDEVGRLAGAFNRTLVRLEQAFASQRRFVADAAHELRTPLTVLRGQLELVASTRDAGEKERSLLVALDELDRMARIVDDLLVLARLDEGMTLRREPVEVELVLREALLRALLIARRDAHVEVEPGLYTLADPDRLLQVVTNLVRNAFEYTDPDSWILLAGRQRDGYVEISVSDDGPGIPPEDLPHVFERLYRGSSARNSSDGSGLGLAIVASLVEAMGGSVTVRSTPGVVTTFTIELPLADAPAPVSVDTDLEALSAPAG